ncbi:RES family NAD+ phosphorylase [Cyclobacterium salsum]|uniref:RES family NAD+ phosphorylase n=1 Tax=Cyclobacterium salsum TaxID=2666329 RepID=UPI0037446A3E
MTIKEISIPDLPENWNHHPPNRSKQKIGDDCIDSDECLLKVPSAVVKGDFNILINPCHKEFGKIKIISVVDFPFDKRILRPGELRIVEPFSNGWTGSNVRCTVALASASLRPYQLA